MTLAVLLAYVSIIRVIRVDRLVVFFYENTVTNPSHFYGSTYRVQGFHGLSTETNELASQPLTLRVTW